MKTVCSLAFAPIAVCGLLIASALLSRDVQALNSCAPSPVTSIVSFSQGSASDGTLIDPALSNPYILLGAGDSGSSLALGIGGSITVSFTVPLANYPAAGAANIVRPTAAMPCSSHPVQAAILGSTDGITFTQLGVTCEGGDFSLGDFPWISHLRIVDTTDRSNPAFSSSTSLGFTVRSIAGPGCLKFSHCAKASTLDPTLAKSTTRQALSLGALGSDFVLSDGAVFEEYGNGSARFIGSLSRLSNPDEAYDAILSFTGRVTNPPTASPLLLLRSSAYLANGGPIDPSQWYYYKTVRGALSKTAPVPDQYHPIEKTIHSLQIGDGADGRSGKPGAATTFSIKVAGAETSGELAFSVLTCPSVTPTPTPSPLPTAPSKPTDTIDDSANFCSLTDLTEVLALLDQALLKRGELVFKASRATVSASASRSNLTFQTQRRSRARNLTTTAWATVWQHPWSVLRCPSKTSCTPSSLIPLRENIRNSVRILDSYVASTISAARRRVSAQTRRSLFKKLRSEHSSIVREFANLLEKLPAESFTCPGSS